MLSHDNVREVVCLVCNVSFLADAIVRPGLCKSLINFVECFHPLALFLS